MTCEWCGHQGPDAPSCEACGRSARGGATCATCGVANPDTARYCDACGEPLSALAHPAGEPSVSSVAGALPVFGATRLSQLVSPTAAALIAIVAAAAVLRLANLTAVPPNVTADEADNLQVVYHILAGTGPGFFGLDWKPAPAFSMYLTSAFFGVLGESIVGMRMASVVLSLVSLPVFYLVARQALSRAASLSATFLLGTGLWYLHFSRSGWENAQVGLYALLATLALTTAVKRGSWYLYAAAGVFAALGLYGYTTGRTIIIGLLLYLPVALLIHQGRRRLFVGYAVLLAVCAVLFLPQLKTALDDWDRFNHRTRVVSIFNTEGEYRGDEGLGRIALHQVWRTIDGFVLMDSGLTHTGLNRRYVPPGWAVLDRITGVLFWLGLIVSVRRFRKTALWWAMLLAMLFPVQVLSTGTPDAARAVGAAPFFYLFAAVGVDFLFGLGIKGRQLAKAAAVPVLLAVAYINISAYFDWMGQPSTSSARQPAVEVDEFAQWQELQKIEAEAGRYGFNVGEWHEMRGQLRP